ncbi:condensin subunit ScpB [Halopseudomonas litoralis]|uniref:Condensin subunit ScpB n=1 Tax=Halopseudomonas litoralis TaxID=797277 RepID=A0A1H1SV18_9GAMM|nr:SMC-Scp complex subunit ScpB [Halopseudomonas litoralis]SDS51805.1 condensin subunit ScpB [Halopseudomonas litoralis]
MTRPPLERILEALLQASTKPLSLERMRELLDDPAPSLDTLRKALSRLADDCAERSVELREVASGWRLQVRDEHSPWVSRLWEERPQRYSRALLETLSLIAYRQPITRGEIEDVRGVAVSSQIIRTLLEREWVRVVGHREVPGRPAMYATTRQFLDYFNLCGLADLPPLAELREISDDLPPAAAGEAAGETAPEWMPVTPLAATDQVGAGDFGALLEELNAMETDLKTDFNDLLPPSVDDMEPDADT